MTLVYTSEGLVDRKELRTVHQQHETEEADGIVMSVEWYRGDKLVRRDGWLNLYRPQEIGVGNGS